MFKSQQNTFKHTFLEHEPENQNTYVPVSVNGRIMADDFCLYSGLLVANKNYSSV